MSAIADAAPGDVVPGLEHLGAEERDLGIQRGLVCLSERRVVIAGQAHQLTAWRAPGGAHGWTGEDALVVVIGHHQQGAGDPSGATTRSIEGGAQG